MIRENEEAVMNLLKTITLKDENGKEHQVKIVYANGDKAKEILSREVIKQEAGAIDKICLPMISFSLTSICQSHMTFKAKIYSLYRQDANKIIEKLFDIEKEMQDRVNGEGRLVFGRFAFEDGENEKQMRVEKVNFPMYFYTK